MSTPLRERPDAPLGTLIFRAGLLPAETIESALEEGVKTGKRLGEILTERGLISEVDLARLLAGQKGLDFVTLREQIVDPSAAGLFTEEQAKLFRALPYGFEDGLPVVAIADPTDEVLLRNIREGLGREDIKFVVSTRGELAEISGDVYSKPLQIAPPAPEPAAEQALERAAGPEPAAEPEQIAEPEPVAEIAPEPVVEPAPEPTAEAVAEVGWPQISPDPTPEPEPAPVAYAAEAEAEPAPEPALDPEPAPEVSADPYTNGVVPPEAAPLLQAPAPEPVAPSLPEPAPVEVTEPALHVPAPEPLPQVEQPAPEPVAAVEPMPAPQPLQVSEPAPEPQPQSEPAADPEPVLEPAAMVEPLRALAPVPAPEPLPAPEPIASPEPAPLPEPTPPPAPYPPAAAQPEAEPEPEPAPDTPEPVVPETPVAEAESTTLWRVLIRLTNGERVDAGDFPDPEAAKQHAKSLITQVAEAEQGDWPFISGRFLKPDTIVSVDIAEHDGDGPA